MVDDLLSRRGLRDASTIHLVTPMPMPIPISRRTSDAIIKILEDHGIEYWPSSMVTHLDPTTHVAHLADGRELPYDLFLGIPVHCAPAVVADTRARRGRLDPGRPRNVRDPLPGRLRRRRRHERAGAPSRRHRRRRGGDGRRGAHRADHRAGPRRRPMTGSRPATSSSATTSSVASTSTSSRTTPRSRSSPLPTRS